MFAQPVDPIVFMNWLADLPARREHCLECGAGQAEVTAFMAERYDRATALDIEPRLLVSLRTPATPVCGSAAALPFRDNSIDLVVSVQALHHFAVADHLREAKRVLRKGGVFAALCWGEMELPPNMARAYEKVFRVLEPHWDAGRAWVLRGYAGLEFDGKPVRTPRARMTRFLSVGDINSTIARWSATRRARAQGIDVPAPRSARGSALGQKRFPVSWPLLGRVFRA